VTVAESPQLLPSEGRPGATRDVVTVGVVVGATHPLGRSRAATLVLSVPLPTVPSVHVALQSTLIVVAAASSEAVNVCVNDWDVAAGGDALATDDAAMARAVVLSVP
jgi:hypothetical protein